MARDWNSRRHRWRGLCVTGLLVSAAAVATIQTIGVPATRDADGAEVGCTQATSCVPGVSFTSPGDADCDATIDGTDLDLLAAGLFCDRCADCDTDDANGDGRVSAADLLVAIGLIATPGDRDHDGVPDAVEPRLGLNP